MQSISLQAPSLDNACKSDSDLGKSGFHVVGRSKIFTIADLLDTNVKTKIGLLGH